MQKAIYLISQILYQKKAETSKRKRNKICSEKCERREDKNVSKRVNLAGRQSGAVT
jgi:hypothetical protein